LNDEAQGVKSAALQGWFHHREPPWLHGALRRTQRRGSLRPACCLGEAPWARRL